MYHYVLLGAVLASAIIWAIYRLAAFLMKRPTSTHQAPDRTIESANTNTSSSIVITEDGGTAKKAPIYNVDNRQPGKQKQIPPQSCATKSEAIKFMSNYSDDSLRSRNSFGFVPSIRSVAPLSNRGQRGTQNFLMLLDSLDPIEDEEAARKRRQMAKNAMTDTSSSALEVNSSDETASQTLIGHELDRSKDLGRITLDFIRLQSDQ